MKRYVIQLTNGATKSCEADSYRMSQDFVLFKHKNEVVCLVMLEHMVGFDVSEYVEENINSEE